MEKIIQIFKLKDLRKKILIVIFLIFVYRLLASIPIPGVDALKLQEFFSQKNAKET